MVLSKDVLAVGISQRTDAASIEKLLVNIFKKNVGFKKVLAFEFANNRKFMHLDTVFTMVDYDKFTIHPEIEGDLRVYSVTYVDDKLKIVEEKGDLAEILAENLGVEKVHLIRCGGGNIVAAAREQLTPRRRAFSTWTLFICSITALRIKAVYWPINDMLRVRLGRIKLLKSCLPETGSHLS